MRNYYLLFMELESRKFMPGNIIRTRCMFNGLMNYMKEERAKVILRILDECDSEAEYRERMGARFVDFEHH